MLASQGVHKCQSISSNSPRKPDQISVLVATAQDSARLLDTTTVFRGGGERSEGARGVREREG